MHTGRRSQHDGHGCSFQDGGRSSSQSGHSKYFLGAIAIRVSNRIYFLLFLHRRSFFAGCIGAFAPKYVPSMRLMVALRYELSPAPRESCIKQKHSVLVLIRKRARHVTSGLSHDEICPQQHVRTVNSSSGSWSKILGFGGLTITRGGAMSIFVSSICIEYEKNLCIKQKCHDQRVKPQSLQATKRELRFILRDAR